MGEEGGNTMTKEQLERKIERMRKTADWAKKLGSSSFLAVSGLAVAGAILGWTLAGVDATTAMDYDGGQVYAEPAYTEREWLVRPLKLRLKDGSAEKVGKAVLQDNEWWIVGEAWRIVGEGPYAHGEIPRNGWTDTLSADDPLAGELAQAKRERAKLIGILGGLVAGLLVQLGFWWAMAWWEDGLRKRVGTEYRRLWDLEEEPEETRA